MDVDVGERIAIRSIVSALVMGYRVGISASARIVRMSMDVTSFNTIILPFAFCVCCKRTVE